MKRARRSSQRRLSYSSEEGRGEKCPTPEAPAAQEPSPPVTHINDLPHHILLTVSRALGAPKGPERALGRCLHS